MTTPREVLVRISESASTSETDEKLMRYVLSNLGYANVVIVCGVVYLEGKGTFDSPPASMQNIARTILKAVNEVSA